MNPLHMFRPLKPQQDDPMRLLKVCDPQWNLLQFKPDKSLLKINVKNGFWASILIRPVHSSQWYTPIKAGIDPLEYPSAWKLVNTTFKRGLTSSQTGYPASLTSTMTSAFLAQSPKKQSEFIKINEDSRMQRSCFQQQENAPLSCLG